MTDEPPRELLAEVIINTIYIDNIAEDIINRHFGFKHKFWSEKKIDEDKIYFFNKYFFQNTGASTKLKMIKEIMEKDYPKIKLPKDLDDKINRFYRIRNIFAHSIDLKEDNKKCISESKELNWKNLYEEHKSIYENLSEIYIEGALALISESFNLEDNEKKN